MKKITSAIIVDFIMKNEIELKSSHKTLSVPIINRIYQKMIVGVNFNDVKISQNLIIDGHHRYISSLLSGIHINFIDYQRNSATNIFEWKNVEFVDEEWDTPSKIYHLNKIDADYNNIDIKKLIEITK